VEAAVTKVSVKDQARQELAARLGMPVEDMLTREDVGPMLKPPRSVRWMEKNPDASPPFFSKGERQKAYYPRQWVEQFVTTGKVKDASGNPIKEHRPWPPAPPAPPPVDPVKRDNALAFLDKLGVKVDPSMKNPAQIKEIEDYRKGVSEGF
jgi:hypothetical protein